ESADEYVASLAALFEQSSDVTFEILYIVAAEKHGSLAVGRTFGTVTNGGGEFESLYARLGRYQGDQYVGLELFDLEDLDVARARLEALRPDPLRIPPNAATRASDRIQEAGQAQDWDALRAQCAPEVEFDDRRRGLRTSGDREMHLASMQYA